MSRLQLAETLAQLGRREPALAALDAAVSLIDPADAVRACARAPARRDLVPQLAVRPDAARAASAQLALDALDGGVAR